MYQCSGSVSESVSQMYEYEDPDPYQDVTDPHSATLPSGKGGQSMNPCFPYLGIQVRDLTFLVWSGHIPSSLPPHGAGRSNVRGTGNWKELYMLYFQHKYTGYRDILF
jgi:hypothetical protein